MTRGGGRRRVLLRGRALLRLGVFVAALLVLAPLVRGRVPGAVRLAVAVTMLAAALLVRHRWWVFGSERAEVEEALVRSCRMVLAPAITTPRALHIRLPQAELIVRMRARAPRVIELGFDGPWADHRKAELVRAAIAKQFEPPLPRLRFRLRR